MVKVYAVADSVPKSSNHLTAGKEYIVDELRGDGFMFIDDFGYGRYSLWRNTRAHLDGKDWRRVEREE